MQHRHTLMAGPPGISLSDKNMFFSRKDSAVSEIIGAVILISVVMTGMGLISVILLSTPPPESQPQVSLRVSCCECSANAYSVFIRHVGGDQVSNSDLVFTLNGGNTQPNFVYIGSMGLPQNWNCVDSGSRMYKTWGDNQYFKAGQYATINSVTLPQSLVIFDKISNQVLVNASFSCNEKCQP